MYNRASSHIPASSEHHGGGWVLDTQTRWEPRRASNDQESGGSGVPRETEVPGSDPCDSQQKKKSSTREIVETLLLALLIFVLVRSVVLNFRVDGTSMQPTLTNGEMLIVNRRAYAEVDLNRAVNWIPGVSREGERSWHPFSPPTRGDIVVFDPPGQQRDPYIKRIIALPGEHVLVRDGAIYIDGQRLDEPYVSSGTVWGGSAANDEYVVEEGHVFVLGDNRTNSSDSRVFGSVPLDDIIGKAWVAYWPPSEVQLLPPPAYATD